MDPINPIAGNPEAINHHSDVSPSPKRTSDNHWVTILAVAIFILLAIGTVAVLYYQNQKLKNMLASYQPTATPTSSAPSPTPDLNTILVSTPSANTKVISPLKISGTVPAGWMFEGVFPIKLLDSSQKVLAQGQTKEKVAGSWQSGMPVDFTATLTFKSATGSGTLVLENDNPSGNPANSKTFEIPVKF